MSLSSLRHIILPIAAASVLFGIGIGAESSARAAKCPNLHIVLDRSGSMTSTVSGGKSRWDVAKEAINKVLDKYDNKFPIGLSIFPRNSCDSELVTAPAYKSKVAIQMGINRTGPSGSTPSGTAVRDAAMIKELRDPDRKQFLLLITDGGPGCGGEPDSCNGTTSEIQKAFMQAPSINTFVVGFGGGLSASEQQCMTNMANAGGKPAATPEKYYKADNADDLNKALSDIIEVIMGGGDVGMGGLCDDTCYTNGCKVPGQVCVAGECVDHPCAGVVCPKSSYCYTDGTSPGICVKACTKACGKGTRCNMGACSTDPCNYACPAGTVCNSALKRCESDPLCGNMPIDEKCRGTSACRAGKCIDDPCRYITCPTGTRCVLWEGTCDLIPNTDPPDMSGENPDEIDTGKARGGCSTIPGGAESASFGVAAAYFLTLIAVRRRRQPRV